MANHSNLLKSAVFSDIHFGRCQNSPQHNQDCSNFIDWFCSQTKTSNCDNVIFMGDWHENRSSLNISTLNFSYQNAKKLNDLNIPIFFIIGNHDLYQRHTRDIHSIIPFTEFNNFKVINEITIIDNLGDGSLLSPYLFHEEYDSLKQYKHVPFWAGHFEFKGFEVTGYGTKMMSGPDPTHYKGPKNILSGHFHKRQSSRNIHYIGNPFGMDMGDAGDFERGMAIYDHISHKVSYVNWEAGPKYQKVILSELINDELTLHEGARVKCLVDIEVSFDESSKIRQKFIDDYHLREFKMEEDVISLSDVGSIITLEKLSSIDDLVEQMLQTVDDTKYNKQFLTEIYKTL